MGSVPTGVHWWHEELFDHVYHHLVVIKIKQIMTREYSQSLGSGDRRKPVALIQRTRAPAKPALEKRKGITPESGTQAQEALVRFVVYAVARTSHLFQSPLPFIYERD